MLSSDFIFKLVMLLLLKWRIEQSSSMGRGLWNPIFQAEALSFFLDTTFNVFDGIFTKLKLFDYMPSFNISINTSALSLVVLTRWRSSAIVFCSSKYQLKTYPVT